MDAMVKDAVKYAKSKKEYSRILSLILVRYKSLGRFSGYIFLENVSDEESKVLGAVDYKVFGKKDGKLSIKKFIAYFSRGKYENLCFEDFMKEYFREELTTNREFRSQEEDKKLRYFNELIKKCKHFELGAQWLTRVISEKNHGYIAIMKEYEVNKEELSKKLYLVMRALSQISFNTDKLEPLPLFSSKVTKDPHFFDIGTSSFRLMIFGLCYHLEKDYPQNVEEINEILYMAGIARDEISIFTTIYGINALNEEREHLGWQGFYNEGEPLHISIKNLNNVNKFKVPLDKVFIFENPIVFMEVIRELQNKDIKIKPALICTSGQLNTASLMLLDKLYLQGYTLYYSGDFDPEGLMIADKLKVRYEDKLILWRYTIEDYLKIRGNKSFEGRESKLLKLQTSEIYELMKLMEKDKLCGYQELLIEEYVNDVINILG